MANRENKKEEKKRSAGRSSASAEDQARVDELLANPNRQPAEDKELDQLLHRKDNAVVTGDVSVDPVAGEGGSGMVTRAVLSGKEPGAGDNVTREIGDPDAPKGDEKPEGDATEAGASRAGSAKADEVKNGR